MLRKLALISAVLTALLVLTAGAVGYAVWQFREPGPLTADTVLVIPRGAGLAAIADRLAEAGVVRDRWLFIAGVKLSGGDRALRAGEYAFPSGISAQGAMELIHSGRTVTYTITVPEGLTSAEVVALLAAEDKLSGELAAPPPEGSLLPETYRFSRGDSRGSLVERMQAAMQHTLAELWPGRTEGLPLVTPREAVTLASIVEKETGVAAERPLVASVFINRLKRGMPLQSDPTVIYGLTGGRTPLGRDLLHTDLDTESAYNTYRVSGLPPGPIANPGRAAIAAVLAPADTEFLYFVADGSGGHAFARTLAEHNRNVASWRRTRNRAGQPG